MNINFLATTPLFQGTTAQEIEAMLDCLGAREGEYGKSAFIYHAGDLVSEVGLVLTGGVSIEIDDLWGNKTVLDYVTPGRIFAEAYACAPGEPMMVNAVAAQPCEILFLDVGRIVGVCSSSCGHHARLIRNLLGVAAQKNLNLSRRSLHTAPKSIRGKLLSYLSYQAMQQGSRDIYIPFNRQQLADYLNVDRSAMSAELGKMRKEGILTSEKNHFVISEAHLEV